MVSVSFIIVTNQILNIYPFHAKVPFLYPTEKVRKTMTFSGGKEKQHWRALGTSITVTTTDNFFSCWTSNFWTSWNTLKHPWSKLMIHQNRVNCYILTKLAQKWLLSFFFHVINSVSAISLIHQRSASSRESHWDQGLVCIFDKMFLAPKKKKEKLYCQFQLING